MTRSALFKRTFLLTLIMAGCLLIAGQSLAQPEPPAQPPAAAEGIAPREGHREHKRHWRREHRRDRGMRDEHKRKGGRFLKFVGEYIEAVQDPYKATGLAVLGMKEHHRRNGTLAKLNPELEELLEQTNDQKMRNILLFAMRQAAEELQDNDRFLEINQRIIKENLKPR